MKDQIWYKNKKFNIDQLQGTVHGLVGKCRKVLMKEMMKVSKMEEKEKKELLAVPWVRLKDDPNCKKMGHNFV